MKTGGVLQDECAHDWTGIRHSPECPKCGYKAPVIYPIKPGKREKPAPAKKKRRR